MVVTRIKVPDEVQDPVQANSCAGSPRRLKVPGRSWAANGPPSFRAAMGRLSYTGFTRFKWLDFKLECPVSPRHWVQSWSDPGKCPKCGIFLEKSVVPCRIWD